MKGFTITYLLIAALALLTLSCQNRTENSRAKSGKAETKSISDGPFCFRNEYPFNDNSGNKDIEELNLQISDRDVRGTYNWLPAFKDQRKGTIAGTIDGNIVQATYSFMQEGISDNVSIQIILSGDKAKIESDQPGLGLSTEIKKISCPN